MSDDNELANVQSTEPSEQVQAQPDLAQLPGAVETVLPPEGSLGEVAGAPVAGPAVSPEPESTPAPAAAGARKRGRPRKAKPAATGSEPSPTSAAPAPTEWWPSEDEIDSEQWKLFSSGGEIGSGSPIAQGTYDALYEEVLRRRQAGDSEVIVASPDGRHVVLPDMEEKLKIASIQARNWSVELQTGGVKQTLARGIFPKCVETFEAAEKNHQAGTLVFLDPTGGVYIQRLKPMYRTVVTTPKDKDRIALDEESFKRYLQGADGPAAASDDPKPVPMPPIAPAAPVTAPVASVAAPVAAAGVVQAIPSHLATSGDLLFEVLVLERILVREREAQLQFVAGQRTLDQQVGHVVDLLNKLRGGS